MAPIPVCQHPALRRRDASLPRTYQPGSGYKGHDKGKVKRRGEERRGEETRGDETRREETRREERRGEERKRRGGGRGGGEREN